MKDANVSLTSRRFSRERAASVQPSAWVSRLEVLVRRVLGKEWSEEPDRAMDSSLAVTRPCGTLCCRTWGKAAGCPLSH